MRILATGTEGYIGTMLVPLLLKRGHEVMGVDTGFYKSGWLFNGVSDSAKTLSKDIRHLEASDLEGIDAVVHMAELSNDPTGELAPDITYKINHEASVRLAELAKSQGVKRFVYTSSCSVYGLASDDFVDESSELNPLTAYAICKTYVERDVGAMADDNFSPVFLRNATAFGASPRMRFDLVLNNLCGLAHNEGQIIMTSDGTPWRPLVHILDIGKAIACALEAPTELIHNETYNVGDTKQNYRVREVAEQVAEIFTGCALKFGEPDQDQRSYRVNCDKINERLPGFSCDWNAERGVRQFHELFAQIDLNRELFGFRGYTRLAQLKHLIGTRQIDEEFFWNTSSPLIAP